MSRPNHISDNDIQQVVRLIGAVAGMQVSIAERSRYLAVGLAELIEADVWTWSTLRAVADAGASALRTMDGGCRDERERTLMWHNSCQPDFLVSVTTGLSSTRHTTYLWNESHPGWGDGSVFEKYARSIGLEQVMFSVYPMANGATSILGMHRRSLRRYTERERSLLHLVVGQIDWLHHAGADVAANKPLLDRLGPRQREILIQLLGGFSRKQIAKKLGLSDHTVGDYVKKLHRLLGVSSRGELLTLFINPPLDELDPPAA